MQIENNMAAYPFQMPLTSGEKTYSENSQDRTNDKDKKQRIFLNMDSNSGDDTVDIDASDADQFSFSNPVAANEHGRIWGDPHFVGGDGGKFDVQGEAGKIYDLLNDSNLQLRGQFYGWDDGKTVIGETGLTIGQNIGESHYIHFNRDGSAWINSIKMGEGRVYELVDGGTAKLEGKTLTITTAEGYTIKQEIIDSGDKAHIDIDVDTGKNGVDNGQMPTGLLGLTFDADSEARNGKTGEGAQGEGAITGSALDYEKPYLNAMKDDRDIHIKYNPDLPYSATPAPAVDATGTESKQSSIMMQMFDFLMQLINLLMGMLDKKAPESDNPIGNNRDGNTIYVSFKD